MLPFTAEQFFAVFANYNETVWPAQWLLRIAALSVLLLALSGVARRDRTICLLFAGLWAWMAIAYHLLNFSRINPAAYAFAAFFLTQAVLFLWWAMSNRSLSLDFRADLRGAVAISMLTYAVVVYPLLSVSFGQSWPSTPTFGVPCPTTIFTLGILTGARAPRTWILAVVPLLWSLVGGSAAFLLGVWQDLGLLATGLAATAVIGVDRIRARS